MPRTCLVGRLALGLTLLFGSTTTAASQSNRPERIADAQPGAVRVLATAAIRVPLEAVRAEASKAIGRPLVIEYGSARGNLKDAAMAGAAFEVALLLPDVDEVLVRAGKLVGAGVVIAKTDIAIGLRGDVTPDLSTPDAVRAAMLGATSLRWAPTGAALFTVNTILDTLRIREAATAKHNASATPAPLRPGEYEINIYPLSEILVNQAVRNAGPVVAPLQVPAVITATVSTNTPSVDAAKALVAFLRGPAIEAALKSNGFSR